MKKLIARYRGFNRPQKWLFWLTTTVAAYALIGFLIAPPIVRAVLESKLPELLHRQVRIETVRLNPFALSATVENFRVSKQEGDGELLGFDKLYLNLESMSLFKQALIVQSISLDKPRIDFSRLDESRFSFSDLLTPTEPPSAAAPAAEPGKPALFSINNIQISGGSIVFHDLPKGAEHKIEQLNLAIPSVSNLPSQVETFVEPLFSATVNGTPLEMTGGSKPFADSRSTGLDLQMEGIDIPEYLAYIPNPTGLTLASALLDLQIRVAYQLFPNQASRLAVTGSVALRDLDVVDKQGESYLKLPRLQLQLADSNLLANEVRLAEVTVEAPEVNFKRLGDGTLLPLALLTPPDAAAKADAAPAAEAAAETPGEPAAQPLRLTIEQLKLNGGTVKFSDQLPPEPAELQLGNIALTVENLSTIPETVANVSLDLLLNHSGRFSSSGKLVLEPFSLTTGLQLQKLALKDFQPYVAQQARLVLGGGSFSVNGELSCKPGADGNPGIVFKGESSIDGLETADTVSGAELLKWSSLQLKGINFSAEPVALSLEQIRFDKPYVQVLVNDDGSLNLATLAKEQPAGTSEPEPAAPTTPAARPQIKVAKLVLQRGAIDFVDRSIKPSYGLKLDQLQGSVSGLSSVLDTRANVDFSARVDQQAPLKISGEVNPLSSEPYADITFDFSDFNLPPISPYTGKYLGYKTGKGKLNLDLKYLIDGHLLDSDNKVFLDQFTLGESVDSPDAISAPIGLAIALLQNRAGEISLDIPVSGDLEDPEFSVGGVVVQVIVNLITKAATSPFALLGALIPEGEDVEHIPFDPGSAELNQAALDKLAVVANILQQRPGLKMDLDGKVAPELDRQALARQQLQQLVRLEKLQSSGIKPDKDGKLPEIAVTAEEYPELLQRAYRKALKTAPKEVREAQAQLKPATPAALQSQQQAFLLGTISVGDEDLRLLALDRANRALNQLVEVGKVESARLFAVEPELKTADNASAEGEAQVQLVIK